MIQSTFTIVAFGSGAVDTLFASPPMARAAHVAPQREHSLSADRPSPRVGNPLWEVSLADLNVTRERPLFSPTRRPALRAVAAAPAPVPAPSPPAPPPEPDQPPLSLVGTIVRESEGVAIFQRGDADGFIKLKIGESYAGWSLAAIKPRAAIFNKGDRDAALSFPLPASRQEPTISPTVATAPVWLNGAQVTALSPQSSASPGQAPAPAWLNGAPVNVRSPGR